MVLTQKPMLLIGSPMCTAFSAWQHISKLKRDPSVVSREFVRAMVHIRFCMELYKLQMDEGRYFLHEHPASATSWARAEVRKIEQLVGVRVVVGDQCQYEAADKAGDPNQETNQVHDEQHSHCRFLITSLLGQVGMVLEAAGRSTCTVQW